MKTTTADSALESIGYKLDSKRSMIGEGYIYKKNNEDIYIIIFKDHEIGFGFLAVETTEIGEPTTYKPVMIRMVTLPYVLNKLYEMGLPRL